MGRGRTFYKKPDLTGRLNGTAFHLPCFTKTVFNDRANDGKRTWISFQEKNSAGDEYQGNFTKTKNSQKQSQLNRDSKFATDRSTNRHYSSVQTRTLLSIFETQLLTQRSPGTVAHLVQIKCQSACSIA